MQRLHQGLQRALQLAHIPSESREDNSPADGERTARIAVEGKLQEHHAFAAPIVEEVWREIAGWLGKHPCLLGTVREMGARRLEFRPLLARDEEYLGRLATAGAWDALFLFFKERTHDVCAWHTIAWTHKNAASPLCRASGAVLAEARAALPDEVPADLAADYFSTTRNVLEGFATAVGFLWNLHRVELELVSRELGLSGPGREALRQLATNDFELVTLLASCRKDIFIVLNGALIGPVTPGASGMPSRGDFYDARHFTLAGSRVAGTLHLDIAPAVLASLDASRLPLPRMGCPAMGAPLCGVHNWFLGVLERHAFRHLGGAAG